MAGRIAGVLVGLVIGVMAAPATAQSLADVARNEAARRKSLESAGKVADGKVLTNADLPASAVVAAPGSASADGAAAGEAAGAGAGGAGDATPGQAAAAAAGGKDSEAAQAPTDDEAGWRARADRVNAALAAARAQVRQLKGLGDRLSLEVQATDPAIVARARAEQADLRAQLFEAEAKEAEALADRQALEQEARIAGVLPAWIQ